MPPRAYPNGRRALTTPSDRSLECKLLAEPAIQERHDLFVLECVAAWADDRLWSGGEWRFRADGPRTIHHCKGGVFFATGERAVAAR